MALIRLLMLALLATGFSAAMAQAPAAGRLLVANPGVEDPEFSETVLLILIHEDNGTAAVFLNRPTWIDPDQAFPEVESLQTYTGALFRGGPVAPAELLVLFEHAGLPPDCVLPILDGVYFSPNPALLTEIDGVGNVAPRARVFAGRAEWGPGQLAREIADGNWRIADPDIDDLFAEDPEDLWRNIPLSGDGVTAFLN